MEELFLDSTAWKAPTIVGLSVIIVVAFAYAVAQIQKWFIKGAIAAFVAVIVVFSILYINSVIQFDPSNADLNLNNIFFWGLHQLGKMIFQWITWVEWVLTGMNEIKF